MGRGLNDVQSRKLTECSRRRIVVGDRRVNLGRIAPEMLLLPVDPYPCCPAVRAGTANTLKPRCGVVILAAVPCVP